MRLTRLKEAKRPTPSPRRRAVPASDRAESAKGEPVARHAEQLRHMRSGGPLDAATYTCACGMVFEAKVSTSVRCPHCGADQAW